MSSFLTFDLCPKAQAQSNSSFNFKIGDFINIWADKEYRKSSENKFEAIGNVVITHKNEAMYGEKATYNNLSGEIFVEGNVRYIGPEYTIYGTEMTFNAKTNVMEVKDARIFSVNEGQAYSLVGKMVRKINASTVEAFEAEYTTCRDCPESWSIYGDRIYITQNEYAQIYQAYLKIRGVTVIYSPYVIFPVKKKRQSGLLFPKISFREDVTYRQPFFWAINDQSDLLFFPGINGKRGLRNELRYRHSFGEQKWIQWDGLQAYDRIYQRPPTITDKVNNPNQSFPDPNSEEVSGSKEFRHFQNYEHHWSFGNWFNHHLLYNSFNDMDQIRDFDGFTLPKIQETDVGAAGFIESRFNLVDFTVEGAWRRNILTDNSSGFDDSYVQNLPEINLNLIPLTFIYSDIPFLQNISIGLDSKYNIFRQNKIIEDFQISEDEKIGSGLYDICESNSSGTLLNSSALDQCSYIRNSERLIVNPYVTWHFGDIGPVHFKSQLDYTQIRYRFPTRQDKNFNRDSTLLVSEANFELSKIFGLAYEENYDLDEISLVKEEEKENENEKVYSRVMGHLPDYQKMFDRGSFSKNRISYKHIHDLKLRHYYLLDEKTRGNKLFEQQIRNSTGQFDYHDSLLEGIHTLGNVETRTGISQKNTVELLWAQTLLEKKPSSDYNLKDDRYLLDNFDYGQKAYFNVSQGIEFNEDNNTSDNLTRLAVQAGLSQGLWGISLSDYYFYQTKKHIFQMSNSISLEVINFVINYRYNSLENPFLREVYFAADVTPLPMIQFKGTRRYDLENDEIQQDTLFVNYLPKNNCWRLSAGFIKDVQQENEFLIDIQINFAEGNWQSLTRGSAGQ